MPLVTDMRFAPRTAPPRPAVLPLLVAVMVLGLQAGFAPPTALASFKSSAAIAAASPVASHPATHSTTGAIAIMKAASERAAAEGWSGPELGDRVEGTVSVGNVSRSETNAAAPQAAAPRVASGAAPITSFSAVTSQATPAVAAIAPAAKSIPVSATKAQAVDSAPCHPEAKPCLPRTQDEVWLVSSRCLCCPDVESATPDFGVWQYDLVAHQWNRSTLEAFLAVQDPSKPDVVWVHGYRIDFAEAQEQALGVYEQLTAGVSGDRPIRLIAFSWPTTPAAGLIEDTRMKSVRTNIDGYYLAWLVNHIDRRVPVNFIGYSFGARIVTGALELLAGGSLMGRTLPDRVDHRAPMQTILIAAALHDDWLAVGRPHGQALEATERMLALNNGCDRALKHYPLVDPCTRPEALGYTGAIGPLGENGRKLYELDMCCTVGKQHNWKSYFYNPSVVARMRPYVGLDDEARLQTAERKVQNEGHVIGN